MKDEKRTDDDAIRKTPDFVGLRLWRGLGARELQHTDDWGASLPGTFAYTPAAGTVLGAGSQTLSVTLTPADTTDYTTATDIATITVNSGGCVYVLEPTQPGMILSGAPFRAMWYLRRFRHTD